MTKYKSRRTSRWLAAMILVAGIPVTASANVIYETDFSHLNGWGFSGNKTTTVTAAPDGDGTAARFDLRRSDPVSFRSELVHISGEVPANVRNATPGEEYWYGFKVWLDKYDRDSSSDIILQFHRSRDASCPSNRSNPPLALIVRGTQWYLNSIGDGRRCVGVESRPYQSWFEAPVGRYETGRWTHFVLRVKWSHRSDGILELWKDGEKVLSRRAPNMFNDQRGPNLKLGIYKPVWKSRGTDTSRRTLYYGELRMAIGANLMDAVSTMHGPSGGTPSAPQGITVDVSPGADVDVPGSLPPIGGDPVEQDRGSLPILRR